MRTLGLSAFALILSAAACSDDDDSTGPEPNPVTLTNHSTTSALVKGLPPGVEVFSLLSSDDVFSQSPSFVFGGSADGAGLLKNPDGTFTLLTNHEDNFAVSRVILDPTFKPVSGSYILNSTNGRWRLCSATLVTPEEHGFGPLFLTVGESGIESMIHAITPDGAPNTSRLLTALGKWNGEQAVPLPKDAYAGKTVILIGDDDSGTNGGQLAMYVSNTVGDLDNGALYVLARTNNNTRERDMVVGQTYPVEFRRINNQASLTGAQLETAGLALNMMRFGRTEDIDYRKGGGANGREIYFNATGQASTGVNADFSRTKYGRVYKLVLDAADPLKGTLEVILDGDDRTGPARAFQNPDNITATRNYLYIKEDPNGYGDETHDAYVYQYNLTTKATTVVMELDHRRSATQYNVGGASAFGSWEYGALIDISETIGIANTFLLAIQPHTWLDDKYRAVDGGTLRPNERQGSQMLVLRGLPR
jgi:hypothetical protein